MILYTYLKNNYTYSPITGLFTKNKSGKIMGYINSKGYECIELLGKEYKTHRLAWLYVYGKWPKYEIDHVNNIRNDNRISNLRDVPHKDNCRNLSIHKCGNLLGVSFNKALGKYRAYEKILDKQIHIGYFNTQLEAHEARINYLKEKLK